MGNFIMKDNRAKVISFINMKGGVGKTTLTINIADYLSKNNKKVLVIDFDPQFNATQSLLLYKFKIIDKNMAIDVQNEYKKLSDQKQTVLQLFENSDVIGEKDKKLTYTIGENLDLIPGDLVLAKEISGDTASKLGCLVDHLNKHNLHTLYDYILVDCPPTWSILTHSSLYASDYYIIPSQIDLYSSIGIQLLEDQIASKLINSSTYQDAVFKRKNQKTGDELKQLGIVFTFYDKRLSESDIEKNLKNQFGDKNFFDTKVPFIPSAPSKIIMYSQNKEYISLYNAIEKITAEMNAKIK